MNKKNKLVDKFSLNNLVGLCILVLGIGFIYWGLWKMPNKPIEYEENLVKHEFIEIIETDAAQISNIIEAEVIEEVSMESLYPIYPKEGDNIGKLTIPVLELDLPIFQGTTENELKKGVGHYSQSVLPGERDNSVLSGHRESVFREIGKLVIGDILTVETSAGLFNYEVTGTRIVDKDDRTVIVPTEVGVLTLTTCYPFKYIGPAPDRYIVSANLLPNKNKDLN